MKLNRLKKLGIFLVIILVCSCQSEYTKLVKSELASGKTYNSVFHGLEFGQTRKEFYEICWNLNKQGIATHGGKNENVQTILYPKDSTQKTKKIKMLFYAKFNPDDIITAMDVTFSYVAWAPWNKDLESDDLLPVIQDSLMKWYPGNTFMKVKNTLVKVDGNRQIQLKTETDRDVSVLIEDLKYKLNHLKK